MFSVSTDTSIYYCYLCISQSTLVIFNMPGASIWLKSNLLTSRAESTESATVHFITQTKTEHTFQQILYIHDAETFKVYNSNINTAPEFEKHEFVEPLNKTTTNISIKICSLLRIKGSMVIPCGFNLCFHLKPFTITSK